MAQFFKAKPRAKAPEMLRGCDVAELDHHLRGVVKAQGKTLFVAGVLPGERVDLQIEGKHQASLTKRHSSHSQRCEPKCGYFDRCGGCHIQYWPTPMQLNGKAAGVARLLKQLGGYTELPEPSLISGEPWGYRRVTRLATWFDKLSGWQTGFRQKRSQKLVPVTECPILTAPLDTLLEPLQRVLAKLPKSCALGHIELVDCLPQPLVRVRVKQVFNEKQRSLWLAFADAQQVSVVMSTDDADEWLRGESAHYVVEDCAIHFMPGHFIQINDRVNQQMVAQAIEWLDPQLDELVLDLYCGVGNFSLPLAKRCERVIAIEGVEAMAQQVRRNAALNGISNIEAFAANLDESESSKLWFSKPASGSLKNPSEPSTDQPKSRVTKVLLDPARAGAKAAIASVAKAQPHAVVYVSCDPATLARDAHVMNQAGYALARWSVMDMFPHTEHVETMVLFTRQL
jgi:23S rRNA (uracil1939-C5)-methyltransferase